ncbi:MAG: M23 family metallopeptidase [Spirochaetales bacterium]|nr:M23 family metallopeptidase [Spirochaetales bacterium]
MSRSDYDDMPSGGGRRGGKGNKGLTLGVLICILVILIIIVVRLIVTPEEKLEVLPPNTIEKESPKNEVDVDASKMDDRAVVSDDSSLSIVTQLDSVVREEMEESITEEVLETPVVEESVEISNSDTFSYTEDTSDVEGTLPTEMEEVVSEEIVSPIEEPISIEMEEVISEEEPIMEEALSTKEEEVIPDDGSTPIEDPLSIEMEETIPDEVIHSIEESFPMVDETPSEEMAVVEEVSEVEPMVEAPVTQEKIDETPSSIVDEPYDPFVKEEVESIRRGLGDLLSKINFQLILEEEVTPSEDVEVVLPEEEVVEPLLEAKEEEEIGPEVEEIMPDSTYESFDAEKQILDSVDEAQEEPTALETEEIREVSKTAVIEEKSGEIIPGSDIRVEEDRVVLLSTPGKAVISPVSGIVVQSGRVDGLKTISIETDEGEIWRFSGFERVDVRMNQKIKKGSALGSIGQSTGSSVSISLSSN